MKPAIGAWRTWSVPVLATMLVAGCGGTGGHTTAGSAATAHHEAAGFVMTRSPRLTLRLIMPSRTVVSGASVKARLVLDNRTGRAIPITDCGLQMFQVLLESQSYHPGPGWLQCATFDSIPSGVSVRQVTVEAYWLSCVAGPPTPPASMACAADGSLPKLHPGTYHPHVFAVSPELPSGPVQDIAVDVVAAG